MKKLTLADIKGPALYAGVRDDFRRHIIEEKRHRRIAVGEHVALVFENRHTVMFQVEEMLRAEHITDPAGIQAELDVYNPLVPAEHELSATLLIEITESAVIRPLLNRLVGIDEHVTLEIGGEEVRAEFEPGHTEEDRIAAVQYVRFRLTPAQAAAFATAEPLAVRIDHPHYRARTVLPPDVRAALVADLAAP